MQARSQPSAPPRRRGQASFYGQFAAGLIAALAALALLPAWAQAPAIRLGPGRLAEEKKTEEDVEERFPGSAPLKTDPEMQRLLVRAETFVKESRYDLASVLWQKVLDEANDTLTTTDGRLYVSLCEEVERRMAQLPPAALQTYRVTADGAAQALLATATPENEEEVLNHVVRRYFMSEAGDDAAYRLGCLAMDRFDFVAATRMFNKVLRQHPDPSPPAADLLLRLAAATARLGDRAAAAKTLAELEQAGGPRPSPLLVGLVKQDVEHSASAQLLAQAEAAWLMGLGNARRAGHMKPLPTDAVSKTLTELLVQEHSLDFVSAASPNNPYGVMVAGPVFVSRSGRARMPEPAASREQLVSQWRQAGWMPTMQLMGDDERVFAKFPDELVCYSAASGQVVWRSAWLNEYEPDGMSQKMAMFAMNMGMQLNDTGRPRTPLEIYLFGDRAHQSLSVAHGSIYSLEGRQISRAGGIAGAAPNLAQMRPFNWQETPRRTRRNWLSAYDARTGKARWRRSAMEENQDGKEPSPDVGFLNTPTPAGDLLLAPVTDGGAIWLYALRPSDGATVWKSYLCDEPADGCNPWSPVAVAAEGLDAYVVCGAGVVFAIDASSGAIRWAVRYQRDFDQKSPAIQTPYGRVLKVNLLNGWSEDAVTLAGRAVIVMASDSDKLLALDRRQGNLLWESPRTSPFGPACNYCLGVVGPGLFVAGKNTVRRYDIPSGRLIWERETDTSFGRGAVTSSALHLPVKDSILTLDPANGMELTQVGVKLTSSDPVGNLYSDGDKLWVAGAGRVFTMTNLEHRLTMLADRIKAGDVPAHLDRMRLLAKSNQLADAIDDLLAAYDITRKRQDAEAAGDLVLQAVSELKLAQTHPQALLQLLAHLYVQGTPPPLSPQLAGRRSETLSTALSGIRARKLGGMTADILAVAPLLEQEFLISSAAQAIMQTAAPPDEAALLAALAGDVPVAQILAASAAAKLNPTAAREPLARLVEAKDDRVRLASARALVNTGDRDALGVFVKLLSSDSGRVRSRSHQSLRALTGQAIQFAAEGKPEDRAQSVEAWQKWVAANGATATLKLPLSDVDVPLGRTLIAYHGRSQLVELDESKQERWTKNVPNPWACQGLPNGHRLVACYAQNMVIEFDDAGNEAWKKASLPSGPFSVQRLENGNTLVACSDAQRVLEIAPDGSTAWEANIQGRPMCARRLENGNTLVALQQGQRVVEVDRDQRIVWEARNLNGPVSAKRLDNGHTLVVQMFTGQVVELDASGSKAVWTKTGLSSPYDAERLPNGNTLIVDGAGVHEVDGQGRVLWQRRGQGASGISQY